MTSEGELKAASLVKATMLVGSMPWVTMNLSQPNYIPDLVNQIAACLAEFVKEHADHATDGDGDTLATWEWMESCGISETCGFRNQKDFLGTSSVLVAFRSCEGPKCWESCLYVDRVSKKQNLTRQDVRDLCRVLGIELKEGTVKP